MTQCPMHVCLLGGGRWSRVIASVLAEIIDEHGQISWVTKYGRRNAQEWVTKRGKQNVVVYPREALGDLQPDAAVVATSSKGHYRDTLAFVSRQIPTLCEKPVARRYQEAIQIFEESKTRRCPVGVGLTFTAAEYIHQFRQLTAPLTATHLHIDWQDPWSDKRHGETKYPDVYTDIALDMLPHCWSLQKVLLPHLHGLSVCDVDYHPAVTRVTARLAERVDILITLSRRSKSRKRIVTLNHGQAILDFSKEPGWSKVNGHREKRSWGGLRPLEATLRQFLDVAFNYQNADQWPLAINHCLGSVAFSEQVSTQLWKSQQTFLKKLAAKPGEAYSSPNLLTDGLVDYLVPYLDCSEGRRIPVYLTEHQIKFVQSLDWRSMLDCPYP